MPCKRVKAILFVPKIRFCNIGDEDRRGQVARRLRYVLADVATKAAYFSLVAAAFIFVSMLSLTGLHP
jgi:hypothetical protein